jgi:hypothetical protein
MENNYKLLYDFFIAVLAKFNLEADKTRAVILDVVVYPQDSVVIHIDRLAKEINQSFADVEQQVCKVVLELNPNGTFAILRLGADPYFRVFLPKIKTNPTDTHPHIWERKIYQKEVDALTLDIDGESMTIYFDPKIDGVDAIPIVYWHLDEVEEDANVAISMCNAIHLYHSNRVELLTRLGYTIL